MSRIGIIGAGAFGTALACVVRRAGHEVCLWAREPEVAAAINASRANPEFLPNVALPAGIEATNDLAAASGDQDFLLVAVPAQHLRSIMASMRATTRPGLPVVSCSKGIERGSCALMPEVIAETLPLARIAVLSGPSFAREIATDLPCAVVLACADAALSNTLCRELATQHFCVRPSQDVIGAAIGGVMKNVIAIASGIAAGRNYGENARATLITFGLHESIRLGLAKGAMRDTFYDLAGIGDLVLTANSTQSRNTALGAAIGAGTPLAAALAGRKQVTEGAFSVEAIVALAHRLGIAMPIAEAVDAVLNRATDVDAAISRLLARLTRYE